MAPFLVDEGHLEVRDLLTCCGHTAPLTRCTPAGVLRSEWPGRELVISSHIPLRCRLRHASDTRCPLLSWVLPGTWHRSSARFPTAGTGRRCSWAAPPAEGRARKAASSGVFVTVMQPVTQDGVQYCRCGRFHCSSRSLLLLGS